MEEKSRSQLKREDLARRKLGEQLVGLSGDQLEQFALPEELMTAIRDARTIRAHGARRRQLLLVGSLLRKLDTAPIEKTLAELAAGHTRETRALHLAERWRDALTAGDDRLAEELLQRFPHAVRQTLIQLIRNARRETSEARAPRARRALLRHLRKLLSEEAPPDPPDAH